MALSPPLETDKPPLEEQVNANNADPVDSSILNEKLGYKIRMLDRKMSRGFVANVGITRVQYSVLSLIATNTDLSQSNVGATLDMDRASTMAVINKLYEAGLIKKEKSPHDKRMHALCLTPKGRRTYPSIEKKVNKHENQLLQGLSNKDREALTHVITNLVQG